MSLDSIGTVFSKYPAEDNNTLSVSVISSIRAMFHSINIEKFVPSGEVNVTGAPSENGTVQFVLSNSVSYGTEQPIIIDMEYEVRITFRNLTSNSSVEIIGRAIKRREVSRIIIIQAPQSIATTTGMEDERKLFGLSENDIIAIVVIIVALAISAALLRIRSRRKKEHHPHLELL